MYQIWGNYKLASQNLLEEFDWLPEARDWLHRYIRWGDFGGYDYIYIMDKKENIYQAVYNDIEEMV